MLEVAIRFALLGIHGVSLKAQPMPVDVLCLKGCELVFAVDKDVGCPTIEKMSLLNKP